MPVHALCFMLFQETRRSLKAIDAVLAKGSRVLKTLASVPSSLAENGNPGTSCQRHEDIRRFLIELAREEAQVSPAITPPHLHTFYCHPTTYLPTC